MRCAQRTALWLALAMLGSCAEGVEPNRFDVVIPDASLEEGGAVSESDLDHDGLCDATEVELGSSSERADTDGDGVPDFIELIYGMVATDASSPAADQIGYLSATPGAETSIAVRLTGKGEGSDFTGFFENVSAPYEDGLTAGDYFVMAMAVSAEPPEAVRAIQGNEQRFLSVLGTVRVELSVLFRADNFVDPEGCARAYPFRYRMRNDEGQLVDERLYLLMMAGTGRDTAEDFCTPIPCI